MSGSSHNPCHLEGQFQDFTRKFEAAQKEQMRLLETIAGLKPVVESHSTDIKDLKATTHDLEMKPAKSANKLYWLAVSSFTSIIGGVTVGLIMSRLA